MCIRDSVQYGIEVIKLDIGVLVEGLRRAVDKTIENVAHNGQIPTPVSYTHLDVYKRQLLVLVVDIMITLFFEVVIELLV